jgi:hypothetical protein
MGDVTPDRWRKAGIAASFILNVESDAHTAQVAALSHKEKLSPLALSVEDLKKLSPKVTEAIRLTPNGMPDFTYIGVHLADSYIIGGIIMSTDGQSLRGLRKIFPMGQI